MHDFLSDIFRAAAVFTVGDFFIFGTLGLEAMVGHGSIVNPQPF